jgi:hypothetical protein
LRQQYDTFIKKRNAERNASAVRQGRMGVAVPVGIPGLLRPTELTPVGDVPVMSCDLKTYCYEKRAGESSVRFSVLKAGKVKIFWVKKIFKKIFHQFMREMFLNWEDI